MKHLLLRCPRCECSQFIIKADAQPKDLATCGRCRGRFIYGHLTDQAEAEAARAALSRDQHLIAMETAPRTRWRWLRFRRRCSGRAGSSPK